MSSDKSAKRKAPAKEARPAKKVRTDEKMGSDKKKGATDAKKDRKRAVHFIEEDQVEETGKESDNGGPKKLKKINIAEEDETTESIPSRISRKETSGNKKTTSKALVLTEEEEIALPLDDDEEEDVAALLAGFTSSEDESEGEDAGLPLDQVPEAKIDKKSKKALEAAKKKTNEDSPGTLYIGRIPHGFYDHQMRAYFTQFGDVTNLRMARNRRTGASKHYAFIEFSSAEVADIVAKTMNNYLMFGHILKVRRIPDEQIHPDLWKNANKRFKKVPWAKIKGGQLRRAKGREYWRSKVEKEEEKREKKRQAMLELGYEYEMPKLKNVDEVPIKEGEQDGPEQAVEAPKAITESPAVVDDVQVEIGKMLKKDGAEEKKAKVKVTRRAVKA